MELEDGSTFNTASLNTEQIFLLKTKLPGEGREGLLVDTGAHDNLVGNLFVKRILDILQRQGLQDQVKWQRLTKPINVSGVGKQSQLVEWSVTVPLRVISNNARNDTTYTAPVVGTDDDPSTVPALWGIKSMRNQRAVIDLVNNELHLCGPGRVYVNTPHGTSTMKIESSLSGHPLVPCTEYGGESKNDDDAPRQRVQIEKTKNGRQLRAQSEGRTGQNYTSSASPAKGDSAAASSR